MSSASNTPHGFVTVRGRGYRPDQVDAYTQALSRDRDAAWERAARLTVLAKDMEAEAVRLREVVAGLAPQAYETLGERAQRLFHLALEEAAEVREKARRAAREQVAQAEVEALGVRRAAEEAADALRAEAAEHARRRLIAARAEADALRIEARREVKQGRGEALVVLREVRQHTTTVLTAQAGEQAERWAAAEREEAAREAAFEARNAERLSRAQAALAEAERAFGEAEESARRLEEEAHARAAEIGTEARHHADRTAQETERVLREHSETWDHVQAQMDQVRHRIITLSGKAAALE
ncbi:cellulose-binding protein [Streptomyces sp. NPDC047085]|uniref:cellulose-binding protein n=1 Tax=Streptomyces sp. NPDC047085 TaxID=3155140 RepID=UPI0033C9217A